MIKTRIKTSKREFYDSVEPGFLKNAVVYRRESHTPYKFVDKIQLEVHGGNGGNGCISHLVLSPGKKRPNGGNGGRGGNVFLVADKSLTSLTMTTVHFTAADGGHGGKDGLTGRRGKDFYLKVPCGTLVTERFPDQEKYIEFHQWEAHRTVGIKSDSEAIHAISLSSSSRDRKGNKFNELQEQEILPRVVDLDTDGAVLLVAEGGKPGQGNGSFAGTSTQRSMSIPANNVPGKLGQHRSLLLELKLIADVGLVGFPNAGKSTLLAALSNARPKIASYPFTTLHPNIGVVEYSDSNRITVADIPGLIEGAHENRGLGHDFLRHIERTKVLLFVIDAAGSEGREPVKDLKALVNELEMYDPLLLTKPSLLFANKVDMKIGKVALRKLVNEAGKYGIGVIQGSALAMQGLPEIACELRKSVEVLAINN